MHSSSSIQQLFTALLAISEQALFIAILAVSIFSVGFVLLSIQLRGEARDKLISYMLEHSPDSVTRLGSNERVLRWTNRVRSLTVVYEENVLKDFTYKYRDTSQDLVISGKLKSTRDFDDWLIKVLCQ